MAEDKSWPWAGKLEQGCSGIRTFKSCPGMWVILQGSAQVWALQVGRREQPLTSTHSGQSSVPSGEPARSSGIVLASMGRWEAGSGPLLGAGWVGTCQPRAPIGRWASSCGCSGSPSPPVVAVAPPWGWGGRAGQMEDYLFPSPAPTQHLKRFLDHVNFVICRFLNTFFCCVCCVNSLRPGHR